MSPQNYPKGPNTSQLRGYSKDLKILAVCYGSRLICLLPSFLIRLWGFTSGAAVATARTLQLIRAHFKSILDGHLVPA
jgi:hypothetical protein